MPDQNPAPNPAPNSAPDWRASLPEDLRGNASLATIKSVDDLARGYVNAQQLIGAKRIALPGQKATPEQLNEFYTAIGRPETIDKYSTGAVKPVEGVNLDAAGLGKAKEVFFKLGLTDAQQKGIMDFYVGGLNEQYTSADTAIKAETAKTENLLRQEWGSNYDANYGMVKQVLNNFANKEVAEELATHLGNNVGLVKMLHKIGSTMSEDTSLKTKFSIPSNTPEAALQQLNELRADANFQKSLNDRTDPGHDAAVELWTQVHRQLGV